MRKMKLGIATIALLSSTVFAQNWSADQREILAVLEQTWDAIKNADQSWIEEMVHENAVYWDWDNFAPRTRDELSEWERFSANEGTTYRVITVRPIAIAVQSGTAVAHYYVSMGLEDDEGHQTTSERRCSDILINDSGDWKFFTWVCGNIASAQ